MKKKIATGQKLIKDMSLRKLDVRDLESEWKTIYSAWKKSWKDTGWESVEIFRSVEEKEYLSRLASKGWVCLAEFDNSIIAFIVFTIENFPVSKNEIEDKIYKNTKKLITVPGFLHEVSIIPEYRDLGLGGNLLAMVEQQLNISGCDGIVLWTREDSKSRKFYLKKGYKLIGKATVPKDNKIGSEDRVYYVKKFNS